MTLSKRQHDLARVDEYVERFRALTTEALIARINSLGLYKEASIALRRVLLERGIDPRNPPRNNGSVS